MVYKKVRCCDGVYIIFIIIIINIYSNDFDGLQNILFARVELVRNYERLQNERYYIIYIIM